MAVRLILAGGVLLASAALTDVSAKTASGPAAALKRLSHNFRAVDVATFDQAVEDILTIEHIKGGSFDLEDNVLRIRSKRCEVSINAELERTSVELNRM